MRRIILLAILLATAITGTAHAQDPCDTNPDAAECNVAPITFTTPDPAVCPYGGMQAVVFGAPDPLGIACNGAPGAQGPPGPQGPQGIPGTAGAPAQLLFQNPADPACFSRRTIYPRLPGHWPVYSRVMMRIGNERFPELVPVARSPHGHGRAIVVLKGRPCGIYLVTVWKPKPGPGHGHKFKFIYTAGANGAWLTGINLR